jgi:hypothetical protein
MPDGDNRWSRAAGGVVSNSFMQALKIGFVSCVVSRAQRAKLQNRNQFRNKMDAPQISPADLEIRWMAHKTRFL